jgi:hypothetical protein
MEDLAKQRIAFGKIMDLMEVTETEREEATCGLELFFEQGWPSGYVTVGMALAAGRGLTPFPYEGITSASEYKQLMAK